MNIEIDKFVSFYFLMCSFCFSYSQIQITNTQSTISTCLNNGTITINATGINPPFLYSITSGPSLHPNQTSNSFNSLSSGSYVVKVSDGFGNESFDTVIVLGNYIGLDFNPQTTKPTCAGGSDGKIIGNRILNTGKAPFTWELLAPSPVTTPTQTNDIFNDLPAGNYTMRITDACGSYRTIVASIEDPINSTLAFVHAPRVGIIGCDEGMVTVFMKTTNFREPYTFTFETTNGVFTTSTPTIFDISSSATGTSFTVQHKIPDFTYGNYLRVTATDFCGTTTTSTLGYANDFTLCPNFNSNFDNCAYLTTTYFSINGVACSANKLITGMASPVTFEFIDIATDSIVDAGTINGNPNHVWHNAIDGISIKPVLGNKKYRLNVQDGCGNNFTSLVNVPSPSTPLPIIENIALSTQSCIDSAGSVTVNTNYFKSEPKLILLSGPSSIGSTKPKYEYSNTILYPDTFNYTSWGGGTDARYNFGIRNLAAGTYQYKVIDDCGSEVFNSFEIINVANLGHDFSYKKGCLGKNEIHYSINSRGGGILSINGPISLTKFHSNQNNIKDSILNVPSGTYQLTYTYFQPSGTNATNPLVTCQTITETITIEGYETPTILTNNSVKCDNDLYIELIADSTKGVPPYEYEIIAGPETFPVQSENHFLVSTSGTYTARIFDLCGNASTREITVYENTFEPLVANVNCDFTTIIYPPSRFYTYEWEGPSNNIFTGNSLIISPITNADTGLYTVTQSVEINGCSETFHTSYHITSIPIYVQNETICPGSIFTVGSNSYHETGVYLDTLSRTTGCDSIVELHLTVSNYSYDFEIREICEGDSTMFGGKFYSTTGLYPDTISTQACDSILNLVLLVLPNPSVNLGADTSFCEGEILQLDAGNDHSAYFWNNDPSSFQNHILEISQSGIYWVEVQDTNGCKGKDTLEITNTYPQPHAYAGKDVSICYGESVVLTASGGVSHKWFPDELLQTSITVTPAFSTTYTLTSYSDQQCPSLPDSVTVHVYQTPEPPFENELIDHCFTDDGVLVLSPVWGTATLENQSGEKITINQPGIYNVQVSNVVGCSVNTQLKIENSCLPKIFVPKAFSPNNDGNNDELEIFGSNFSNFEIKIFNRWGEVIFTSDERNKRWNGSYRGEPMPVGTYPWIIHYETESNEGIKHHTLRGSITLIR